MRWVDTRDELPAPGQRVLCSMNVGTVWEFAACGVFCKSHWIVDDFTRPVGVGEVKYWAPIARVPNTKR